MEKNENIYIKLGLEKNFTTGKLQINIQFNTDAPNFTKDKDVYNWCPSHEEWSFVNEAFEVLAKGHDYTYKKNAHYEQKEIDDEEDFVPKADEQDIVNKFLEKNKKM
jgi:hypothetical protein